MEKDFDILMRFLTGSEKQKMDFDNSARDTFNIFDSYIKAGFTRKEALEIIKAILAGVASRNEG